MPRRSVNGAQSPHSVVKVGGDYYVLASTLVSRRTTRVLANGQSFAVFDIGGDIFASPRESLGFFDSDTRYLSRFELLMAGHAPYFLNSYLADDNAQLRVNLTNPDLFRTRGGQFALPRDSIQIQRSWVLAERGLFHRLMIRNYAGRPLRFPVDLLFAVDFADVFEVRGVRRKQHGEVLPAACEKNAVRHVYRGLDGVTRFTEVAFSREPAALTENRATFELDLDADQSIELETRILGGRALKAHDGDGRVATFDGALDNRRKEIAHAQSEWASTSAANDLFDLLLKRSAADLTSIITHTGNGTFMMAGIPWFATLFGRDSVLTTMSLLPFNPMIAERTLSALAGLQGTQVNDARDEQPGKIVHEMRSGEMAATGEVPFGRYYGSIDATPLYLWMLGRCITVTGNLEFAERLWPSVERALEWIERWGDRDGDGYLEYLRETPRGLANQGWKDSFDAISHQNGELARPPIALAEVQGYLYAAYQSVAELALRLGRDETAARLVDKADKLKASFTRDFWLDRERTVALALDGDKQPCRVMSSNAAHCLATGLIDGDRAAAVCERLLADDMFSGWGVRTLSARERRYNPMSYHNGSVWPHDNALAAYGLARAGNRAGAIRVLEGLFDAAVELGVRSLPELYCGFAREPRLGPVPYPVACHPQAWSAASVFLILQAILGLQVSGFDRKVVLRSPELPSWLDALAIENLKVGDGAVSFRMRRTAEPAALELIDERGSVSVEIKE